MNEQKKMKQNNAKQKILSAISLLGSRHRFSVSLVNLRFAAALWAATAAFSRASTTFRRSCIALIGTVAAHVGHVPTGIPPLLPPDLLGPAIRITFQQL